MKLKITIILFVLLLFGCSKVNGPEKFDFSTFKYPLQIGNKWMYESTFTYSNIRPDTAQLNHPLVMKGSSEIEVVGTTFIGDFLEVMVLKTYEIDSMNPQFGDSATFLFGNNNDGLYEYGFSGRGNMAVPVSRPPTKDEITDYLSMNKRSKESLAKASYDEIKQSLKYPITINSEWMFLDGTDNLFGINKKIIGYEILKTKMGNYKCFIVEWQYTGMDIKAIDYVSKIGLMKRTFKVKNIQRTDENARNHITYDYTQEYNLVEFTQAQ